MKAKKPESRAGANVYGLPPIKTLVYDKQHDRAGILMDVDDFEDPSTRRKSFVAFLRDPRGGREWTTAPANVKPVTEPRRSL